MFNTFWGEYVTFSRGGLSVGITAREKQVVPRTMVTEVAGEEPAVRVFVVQSEERLAYERAMREAAMEKTRQALEKLALRVAAGRLKKAQNIGAAAARILAATMGAAITIGILSKGCSTTLSIRGKSVGR